MPDRPANIQDNVLLAPYTTMKIGGPAKYFLLATSDDDIRYAWQWASSSKIPVRVLGAGANTLVADHGFDGLVIVMRNDDMVWDNASVVASAGVTNGQLIAKGLRNNLGGLQWLIGVPGTVGGSIYGNAGGHGWGIGDMVEWVDIIDETGEVKQISHEQCDFSYRMSACKSHPWIILRAKFNLISVDPTAERKMMAMTTALKNKNQPTTAKSSGCMFMNPKVERATLPDDLKEFIAEDSTISAWRLIVRVGLQSKQLGQVQISPLHANFMLNLGGGTADQVVQLLSLVKQQVRDKLGVQLREEVQYLGF